MVDELWEIKFTIRCTLIPLALARDRVWLRRCGSWMLLWLSITFHSRTFFQVRGFGCRSLFAVPYLFQHFCQYVWKCMLWAFKTSSTYWHTNASPCLYEIRDPADPDKITADGVMRLLEDLGLNPASRLVLVFAWKLKAATQCEFSKDEFTNGLSEIGYAYLQFFCRKWRKIPWIIKITRVQNDDIHPCSSNFSPSNEAWWNCERDIPQGPFWGDWKRPILFEFLSCFYCDISIQLSCDFIQFLQSHPWK